MRKLRKKINFDAVFGSFQLSMVLGLGSCIQLEYVGTFTDNVKKKCQIG